ncbi:TonB-dependent receptor [Aliifodinibius sp. S!AR15-10]|uniref:SusC/RagA family TonB-linked outer membrane protein n=1 Tax=Aliifodinibius sp. S!AR15-10 TaxID=2950437 RepID=UPI00285457F8|nr:TonB-dependent receptor [Aliifodinibius sp. S!AR15-10]MDR8389801.1 TonB-dependent receptor [Aliifodinibius sp. S!AR15-10]
MSATATKRLLILLTLGLFASSQIALAQHTVSGTVTAESDGSTLPGVNILIQGTNQGTATGPNGQYKLTVPNASDTLVFSFIGFETQRVPVQGRSEINIVMSEMAVEAGEELVVVGYGVQQKSDLTGSISSVDSEDISKISTQSLTNALQGKVSGVRVTPTSGRPGDEPEVRIRGVGTLNNSSPLYVVDGMLLDDISFLSPQDVESVEVLKDASATAIYGSRGANGVVLISTKEGRSGQPQISVRTSYGLQRVNKKIEMANAAEYAMLANESAANEGRPQVFQNPDQFGQGTNWQDLLIDDNAPLQRYNISASGGSDQMTYNVSANFYDEKGVFRDADFQRLTFRANNEYLLSDNVTFGHNLSFIRNDRKNEPGDIVNVALRADPTVPVRNDSGEFANTTVNGGDVNPVASVFYNRNDNFKYRTTGTAYLEIDFLENFRFKSNVGVDWGRDERKNYNPEYFVSSIQSNQNSSLNVTEDRELNWLNENTLSYNNEFGIHRVDAVAGVTYQEFVFENMGGSRQNFPGDDPIFWYLNAGDPDSQTNFNTSNSWGIISYLARVNYVYDDRYLLTGTFRRDGSSKFADRHRWSNFPSVAVGWRISNEDFMQNVETLNNLKLRASWGLIGNDKIPSGEAIPTVNSGLVSVFGPDQSLSPGATVTALSNPDLRWEETEQLDIGLEVGLWEDRLTAEVDWYRRETKDILVRVPIPDIVGVNTAPIVNAAKVLNRGFDVGLNWRGSNGDFTYSIGLTGSTVHNEVLSLGAREEAILGGDVRNLGFVTRTEEGHPIGAFYGWKQAGIFQDQEEIDNSATRGGEQPGDIKIADINGFDDEGNLTGEPDGVINDADKTYLGSPIPDFNFGLNFSANYKQFDLALDLDGQMGGQVVYGRQAIRGFRLLNYEEFYLDRWTGPGTSNDEPRITESGHNYEVLDRFIYDSDFLRLRNVQLGYTLPVNITGQMDIQRARIFLNATNVLRFDKYAGYTPQIGGGEVISTGIDRGTYPVPSSYMVGLELQF